MLIYWIYSEVQEWIFSASWIKGSKKYLLHMKWLIALSTRKLGCCYLSWEDILCIIMFRRNIMIFLLVTLHLVDCMLQCVILPTWTSFSDSKHVSLVLFRFFSVVDTLKWVLAKSDVFGYAVSLDESKHWVGTANTKRGHPPRNDNKNWFIWWNWKSLWDLPSPSSICQHKNL